MKHAVLVTLLTLALALPSTAPAQDSPATAQQELINLVGEAIVEETTQRSEEVRKAREVLDVILNKKDATQEEKEQAEQELEEAEESYAKAQKELNQARLDAFAEQCGTSAAQIQAMRDSGMGWGSIAKECGIHPSAAGKGKGKGKIKNKGKGKGKNK